MYKVTTMLGELHDEYVEQVNLAISEGRDDLAEALSAQFARTATTALREGALPALLDSP
jgi:hypothetical protein